MRKGKAITILALAALFAFGCGGGAEPNAAPENTAADESAAASPAPAATENAVSEGSAKPFSKTVSLHGVEFLVESANSASGNKVKITPKGLEVAEAVEQAIDGIVTGAEVGDLDIDQAPEVYVYYQVGSGAEKRAGLVAYSANGKKSMSMINLPEMAPDSDEAKGFKGGDEFAVVESTLVRRFPVFKEGDAADKPTGGTRQLQYKLKKGEAAWQLVVDKVVAY